MEYFVTGENLAWVGNLSLLIWAEGKHPILHPENNKFHFQPDFNVKLLPI